MTPGIAFAAASFLEDGYQPGSIAGDQTWIRTRYGLVNYP